MVKISVTVPVYNVEKYLPRCLNSILNQSFNHEYEVICVDDGSTDRSGEILEEYAQKYPNIKVIHQENQGLSVARNTALKYVRGKYTMFVDSDDFLLPNALKTLYKYAQKHNADVVIFDFIRTLEGSNKVNMQHFENIAMAYKDVPFNARTAKSFVYRFIAVATWNKIYRTSLIKNIEFVKDLNNQDVVHWAQVYTRAKRMFYLPTVFYAYTIQRKDAITQNKGKKVFDVFRAFGTAENVLRESGYFNKFRSIHYAHFTCNLIGALRKIKPEYRIDLVNKIKECPIDIDYDKFKTEDFFQFEKDAMELIRYIKENDISEIDALLRERNIWV